MSDYEDRLIENKNNILEEIGNKIKDDFENNIKILNVNVRGSWMFSDVSDTICSICKHHLFEPCPNSTSKDPCGVLGKCGHGYHHECITKWHKTNAIKCPMCNEDWQLMQKKN